MTVLKYLVLILCVQHSHKWRVCVCVCVLESSVVLIFILGGSAGWENEVPRVGQKQRSRLMKETSPGIYASEETTATSHVNSHVWRIFRLSYHSFWKQHGPPR